MPNSNADLKDIVPYTASLDEVPAETELSETVANLEEHGFTVVITDTADEAVEAIRSRIPAGTSVMTGHSNTLEEIGFMEYLMEGDHG